MAFTKDFTQRVLEDVPMTAQEKPAGTSSDLLNILSMLQAIERLYHSAHWRATCYGTHLLFERLYKAEQDQADALGEKLVQLYGSKTVDACKLIRMASKHLDSWDGEDSVSSGLIAERDLQAAIKKTYAAMKGAGKLTPGMDDYLLGLANDHDTHLYLLGQIKEK